MGILKLEPANLDVSPFQSLTMSVYLFTIETLANSLYVGASNSQVKILGFVCQIVRVTTHGLCQPYNGSSLHADPYIPISITIKA